jgi:hypothetical protein
MQTNEPTRRRRLARNVVAGIATATLAAAIWGAGTGAASAADARVVKGAYLAELVSAQEACLDRTTVPVAAGALARCVGGLAQPGPEPVEVDLWRLFRDCLWLAEQRALDDLDPPTTQTYEDYVNDCLGL